MDFTPGENNLSLGAAVTRLNTLGTGTKLTRNNSNVDNRLRTSNIGLQSKRNKSNNDNRGGLQKQKSQERSVMFKPISSRSNEGSVNRLHSGAPVTRQSMPSAAPMFVRRSTKQLTEFRVFSLSTKTERQASYISP